jgi:hypothetical protein
VLDAELHAHGVERGLEQRVELDRRGDALAHVRTAHSKLRRGGGGGNVAPGRRSISSTAYTSEP